MSISGPLTRLLLFPTTTDGAHFVTEVPGSLIWATVSTPPEEQDARARLGIPNDDPIVTLAVLNPLGWEGYAFGLAGTWAPTPPTAAKAPLFCVRVENPLAFSGEDIPLVAWWRALTCPDTPVWIEARWNAIEGETLALRGVPDHLSKGNIDRARKAVGLFKAIEAVGRGRRPGPDGFKDVQEFEDTLIKLIQEAHAKGQSTKQEHIAAFLRPNLHTRRRDTGSPASVDVDIDSTKRLIRKHISCPWHDLVKKALQSL